jgi:hypothetical protein
MPNKYGKLTFLTTFMKMSRFVQKTPERGYTRFVITSRTPFPLWNEECVEFWLHVWHRVIVNVSEKCIISVFTRKMEAVRSSEA